MCLGKQHHFQFGLLPKPQTLFAYNFFRVKDKLLSSLLSAQLLSLQCYEYSLVLLDPGMVDLNTMPNTILTKQIDLYCLAIYPYIQNHNLTLTFVLRLNTN